MHKKLVIESFNKAKSDTGSKVLTGLSTHIAETLMEDFKFQINEKTLRNYYNELAKKSDEEFSISINIANELAKYLGYKNLRDYSKSMKGNKDKKTINKIVMGSLIIVASYFGYETTLDKCMIWKENRFEKISCEEEGAKPINEELLLGFKKIVPNCETKFFNNKGEVVVWYGKNNNKELEFFTKLDVHPDTGKTLKPITEYMIIEHICSTYN